jgi:hypothetical protein
MNSTFATALEAPLDKTREWLSLPDHYTLAIVGILALVGLILSVWRIRVWRCHRGAKKAIYHWRY